MLQLRCTLAQTIFFPCFVLFIRAVWFTGVALPCSQRAKHKYNTNLMTIHKLIQIIVGHGRFVTLQFHKWWTGCRDKEKTKLGMQHSEPSLRRDSHKMNKPAISSFKLSSYQFHQENSYTTSKISAVSHNYRRKIRKIDINKSSGSSELVHITVGVCMCTFLSAYTSSCVGWQYFMQRWKEMSLDYDSSAAQCSSLKWGAQRLYDTFVDTVAVLFVQLKR